VQTPLFWDFQFQPGEVQPRDMLERSAEFKKRRLRCHLICDTRMNGWKVNLRRTNTTIRHSLSNEFINIFCSTNPVAVESVVELTLTNSMELSTTRQIPSCLDTRQFPSISWNAKVQYRIYMSSPPVRILSQTNPVHNTPS
jgi:hypothetical protein